MDPFLGPLDTFKEVLTPANHAALARLEFQNS